MTQAAVGSLAPLIKVDGADLAPTTLNALIGLRVSSGLRIPSRAVLEFLDDGFKVSAARTFSLGTAIKVTTSTGAALFTGEVTGVELNVEWGAPNVSVIADDLTYKMTLGNKVRTFTQVAYSDVVTQIAGEYGLTASTSSTEFVHEYLLQSDSDFGFLTEMADRAGYDWWVDPGGTLQFHKMAASTDATASLTWGEQGTLHSFSVRASALHPKKVTVNGWDAANKQSVTSTSSADQPTPTADLVQPYLNASTLQGKNDAASAYRMFADQSDGTALANSVALRSLAGAVVATGECGINPAIVVGKNVTVSGAGPASGSYPVTEVEHTYTTRGFDTRFTAGDREPTSLVDTLAAPGPSSFRQDGLVVGVVTNLGDSNSPKGYVKVKFPTLGDQIESSWARVVSTGAGDSRGMTFLPEINDEVIVGFESGDITRPLVIGGLYSGASAALDYGAANGKIAKRQIVSRLGHVVELGDGDEPADQHIWLTLAGGEFFVKLGKDGLSASVPSSKPVSIKAGESSIEIDGSGNIALSGQKITITGKQDVEISGLNVKLKANVAVEGSGLQAKLSGSAQAELSSGGQTAVKGSVVMIN
jgi:phage protein D/phage baseplate assembly protein gpV